MLKSFLFGFLIFIPIYLAIQYFLFEKEITTSTLITAVIAGLIAGGFQAYSYHRAKDNS